MKKWTDEEIYKLKFYLIEMQYSYEKIAKILNRTKISIARKSTRLMIKNNFFHGKSNTRIYKIHRGILNRCLNSKHHAYHNYGGRGIKICNEWKNNFLSFYNWAIENGYQEHLTIDRIDVNGDYCPENCKWATRKEQANNTRFNKYLTIFNETKTLQMWSEDYRCKVSIYTLSDRIKLNWPLIDALTIPIKRK